MIKYTELVEYRQQKIILEASIVFSHFNLNIYLVCRFNFLSFIHSGYQWVYLSRLMATLRVGGKLIEKILERKIYLVTEVFQSHFII
jgi:hypothetical protein